MPGPFDLYGIPDVDAFEAPKPEQPGDVSRGAKVAFGQMAPIAKGVVGLIGATAEQAFGEGGLATAAKNYGLRGFTEGMQRLEPLQRETDDVTVAWQRAKDGDIGALLDWAQYGLGYAVGQAGEAIGAALLGAGAGIAMAPQAAPVAGAAGAVTGLVAKGAVRSAAVAMIEKAVVKEATALSAAAAKTGAKMTAEEATKIATRNITREIGASGALLTLGTGQELGSIYPEAEAEAIKRGEQLTGADLARVWASGLAAGGIEGLTDRLGIQAALGRVRVPGAQTRLGQAGLVGVGGAALEGATEAVQTGIERFGAQKDILSPEGVNEIINASALGAIGGGAIGGAIGAVQGPAQERARSNAAFQAIGAAKSADEAIAAFEQTYEEITVPPEFDANGAMDRLDAQRQRDEQALRQFGPQVSRETSGSTVTSPDVQMRDAEREWQEALPGLPRNVYAQLAQDASIDARATSEGQRAQLRARLSAPGQDPQAALREVFGPDLGNAPRRLQQAPGGSLDVPSMPSGASQAGGSTSIGAAEPFADRLLSLRDLIADSRNRQQVRDTLGPVALNDLMYYLSAADNASLPGQTSDRMLQVAEAILNRAQIQREERPGVGGKPAQAAIDATAAPAQIPLDAAPTGRIRVDADGVAVQEIGADVVSAADRARVDAEQRGQGMTGSFPQGAPDRPGVLVGEGTLVQQTGGEVAPTLRIPGPKTDETVDSGAHEAAASPTNGKTATKDQILGGNAELGHTTLPGLDISVENPAGSERVDLKNDPPKWRNTMKDHYGYIRGSTSIDGEHMDVFMREGTATGWQGTVFVVDQIDPKTGKPDEHKVMLGYDSVDEAKQAYRRNYSDGWKGMKAITAMPYAEFQRWVRDPALTGKPLVPTLRERAQAISQTSERAPTPAAVERPSSNRQATVKQPLKPASGVKPASTAGIDPIRAELATAARSLAERAPGATQKAYLEAVAKRAEVAPEAEIAEVRETVDRWTERLKDATPPPKEKPDDGRPAPNADRPGDEGDRQRPRQEEPQEAPTPRDQARQEEVEQGEAAATPTPETAATEGANDGLQEEGRGRQEEVAPPPAGETPADPFARFDGIMVEQKVKIAETGDVATMRFDAGKALRDLAAREQAITRLRACVLRGGS